MRSGMGHHSMQVPGGSVRGCRLRGVLLGPSQLGHGGGEGDQIRDQRDRRERAVPGDLASQRDQPSGAAKLVTLTRAPGQAPMRRAGGAVVGVGGASQLSAA